MASRFPLLLAVLGIAIAGAAIGIAAGTDTSSSSTTTSIAPVSSSVSTPTTALPIAQIYRQDGPGVVDIKVTTTTSSPLGGTQQAQSEGAGVVYDTKGDILTDEHVVAGTSTATVTFEDGRAATARVLGSDPSSDVAVIRLGVPSSELHPIAFANSASAQVGNRVVAIGSPFGLPETVTSGIVSAVGRSITAPNGFTIVGAVQTDAPINPGNSGGPLLDGSGRVLGLSDQIETDVASATSQGQSSGVGFATPSNMVANIANLIIVGKPVPHAYVGVSLNPGSTSGAQVASVAANSPASRAGLRQGDLITAVNGKGVSSTEQFIVTVNSYSPGQTITLTVKRGGSTVTVRLTVANRPKTVSGG